MKRITAAAVLATVLGAGAARPARSEESGAAFLKISPSARGEALGGMNPAAVGGAQAMGVNPANLSMVEGSEFTSGFATMIGDSSYGTVGLAVRRSEGMVVGGHATYLGSGSLEGRDASGNPTAAFDARDLAAGLSAAWAGETFRLGGTVKAVKQQIGDLASNTAMAGDVGLALRTGTISWGAAALNLGSKLRFRGREEALPAIYSLGAGIPLGGGLTGLAGMVQVAGETSANMGLEYGFKGASLRVGYRSEGGENLAKKAQGSGAQALGGLTGGVGVQAGAWRLDYAVSQTAVEYGMSHRAAVTFAWGGEEAEKAAAAKPAPRRAAPAKSPASMTTGSRRAYDPAPVQMKKPKKRWVD